VLLDALLLDVLVALEPPVDALVLVVLVLAAPPVAVVPVCVLAEPPVPAPPVLPVARELSPASHPGSAHSKPATTATVRGDIMRDLRREVCGPRVIMQQRRVATPDR